MNWNEAADAKLFAGVLATSEGVKLKYDDLATWMGNGCTAKAIQHRITSVRKTTQDTDISAPKTPKTPNTKGKRKAAKEDVDGAGDADDSPTKVKKSRAAPKKKTSPKNVDVAGEEDEEEGMNGIRGESEEESKMGDAGLIGGEEE